MIYAYHLLVNSSLKCRNNLFMLILNLTPILLFCFTLPCPASSAFFLRLICSVASGHLITSPACRLFRSVLLVCFLSVSFSLSRQPTPIHLASVPPSASPLLHSLSPHIYLCVHTRSFLFSTAFFLPTILPHISSWLLNFLQFSLMCVKSLALT